MPRSLLFTMCILVAAAGATIAAPAHAQDAQAQAGRTLFNDGLALFNDGKFVEACPKFEASLKAYPGIGTRGKLAECYEKVGRFASAWSLWREVAQLSMRAGEPAREQFASERAKALEPKLSYLTVTVSAANDAPGLVIKRNGQDFDRSKLGAADPVDAGAIAFEVSAPGKKRFSMQVTVTPGQSAKFDVPSLESLPTAGRAPLPPPPTGPTDFPPPESDVRPWQKPLGLGVAGVGLVGLGIGTIFGLSAKSTYDKAFKDGGGCDSSTKQCNSGGQSTVDDAHTKATTSTIFFVAGAALAAGGLVLFLTAPSAAKVGMRIAPTTYASGGGLVVTGAY